MASNEEDDGPSGIPPTLRDRVIEQIGITTDALDAASANPSDETLDELYKAADNLMRALGRVILEIERQRGQQASDR
ncbi:MAG TPA: hypothetical protein VMA53_04435 [Stellaceae bacterium]|nr:hypothetical protein [Stellaceae bacterium]